jgi:hypothetical protein
MVSRPRPGRYRINSPSTLWPDGRTGGRLRYGEGTKYDSDLEIITSPFEPGHAGLVMTMTLGVGDKESITVVVHEVRGRRRSDGAEWRTVYQDAEPFFSDATLTDRTLGTLARHAALLVREGPSPGTDVTRDELLGIRRDLRRDGVVVTYTSVAARIGAAGWRAGRTAVLTYWPSLEAFTRDGLD